MLSFKTKAGFSEDLFEPVLIAKEIALKYIWKGGEKSSKL